MSGRYSNLDEKQIALLKEFYVQYFKFLDEISVDKKSESLSVPKEKKESKSPSLGFANLKNKLSKGLAKKEKDENAELDPHSLNYDTFSKQVFSTVQYDHPDDVILRFLRARKWDVEEGLKMFTKAITWFHSNGVDNIKKVGEEQINMDPFKKGEARFQGVDVENRPVCFIVSRLHDPNTTNLEELQSFIILLMESARLLFVPPVDTVTMVFDLTGFTTANMDYSSLKFVITCLERYYPESLGRILVLNAPWFFSGIFKVISGMLDPVVSAKIKFVSDVELQEYVKPDQIRKDLGGTGELDYTYLPPVAGENEIMKDTAASEAALKYHRELSIQFEAISRKWSTAPQEDKELTLQRNELAIKLTDAYKKLDPYIRARTIYHRLGILKQGGDADWNLMNRKV